MLECVEENCRKEIAYDRHIIEKNEEDMSYCVGEKPKGLQSIDVSLSNARIRLGNQREKLQYLESSIASLEETSGLPEEKTGEFDTTTHIQLAQKYGDQLQEVKKRLKPLKGKCRQLNIYIDNLKERVEGIVCIVSPYLTAIPRPYLLTFASGFDPTGRKRERIQPRKGQLSTPNAKAATHHCQQSKARQQRHESHCRPQCILPPWYFHCRKFFPTLTFDKN
jgi:hypothetical protein